MLLRLCSESEHSNGFDDYRDVLDLASRAADKFNISTLESQKAIAQLFGRLRPLGLTLLKSRRSSTDSTPLLH